MHLLDYTNLFRGLAQRHRAILATPDNNRFTRIIISADPIQKQIDLAEFYAKLRSRIQAPYGQPVFVLENYQVDYNDNQGDYLSRQAQGAFLVLQLVRSGDFDGRDTAIDNCEHVAEELLAAALRPLREEHQVRISVGDAWAEHLGPIADGYYGVRMNFAWTDPATRDLSYNADHFTV